MPSRMAEIANCQFRIGVKRSQYNASTKIQISTEFIPTRIMETAKIQTPLEC